MRRVLWAGLEHERQVRDAYGASLVLVVASVVVAIAIADDTLGSLVAGLLQVSALMAVLQVTRASPRTIAVARTSGIVGALLATVLTAYPVPLLSWVVPLLWGLVVGGVAVAILRHVRTYESVTVQAVLGLVTVYLLLGLVFAYAFMLTNALGTGFFSASAGGLSEFVYFSYVTLATVGYGDLVAAAGVPRALAVLEAVLGQLYLVTVVALAVGRFGLSRRELR